MQNWVSPGDEAKSKCLEYSAMWIKVIRMLEGTALE